MVNLDLLPHKTRLSVELGLCARIPNPMINMTLVYAPFLLPFCTHWSSKGEAADNEKLHNTAGNKGKVLQLVDKNLFSGVLTGASLFVQRLTSLHCFEKIKWSKSSAQSTDWWVFYSAILLNNWHQPWIFCPKWRLNVQSELCILLLFVFELHQRSCCNLLYLPSSSMWGCTLSMCLFSLHQCVM